MAFKIVIAGTYPDGTFEKFQEALCGTGAELIEAKTQEAFDQIPDADVVLLRILKMPAKDIDRLPSLKAVLRWGVGFDSVDLEAAGKRGVYVCNTPGANAHAVAELVVLMILVLSRKVLCYRENITGGQWAKNAYLNQTVTLHNKLVGIIGGGNIGKKVARDVQAFGAVTQYYDPYRMSEEMEKMLNMRYVSLDELLRTSNIITIHVPLMDSTWHMIGAEQINAMKDGAILINCARGGLVDDMAVLQAVESGKLAGAGIDTLEIEPPPVGSAFRGHTNILVTPHIGGDVSDVGDVAIPMISENMRRLVKGETPLYIVNERYLKQA